jgi:hypothetical protein
VVGFSRPDYFSAIIVLAEKGITDLDSLNGKKVAFGAVGSTSKHLAPMQLLKDRGMDPLKDIEAIHIADNVAWEALRRGLALCSSVTTWCHVCRPYPMCCMGSSHASAPPSGAASFEKVWIEQIVGKAIATPQRRTD